ncbi:MAG TPA: hypothetical protein PKA64_21635, partial [Myxococcota bacterium]|nr:hypothetical protein [Myxococcota bacterium]
MSSLKPPLVIDLGRKRKKSIRNLKAGTGKLMSEVDRTVEALRANGATLGDGAPLVLVVERKDKRAERRRKARKLARKLMGRRRGARGVGLLLARGVMGRRVR